jgi:polyhydroxyalkanoate synthesis regulator phasin
MGMLRKKKWKGAVSFMMSEIGGDLKKLLLAGLGAAATTAEKSKQIIDDLVEKGELTLEQGKVLNEELKRNIKNRVDQHVSVTVTKTVSSNVQDIIAAIAKLNREELEQVKAAIARQEKLRTPETDGQKDNAAE